jgi:hypothetical protein
MLDLVERLSYSVLLVQREKTVGRQFVFHARVAELADALDLGSSG